MNIFKKHSIVIILFLIGIIALFTSMNVKWGDTRWHRIITNDAKGYYAYLPAIFIYNDLSFAFYNDLENDKYKYEGLEYDYRYIYEKKVVNKYYSGTALAQAPFFLMAQLLSKPLGYDSDGYSKIYWVFISIAAIFYFLLGLIFLWKLLLLYELKSYIINITILSTAFGTHLFYYSIFEPGMSHVYSFAFITWFLFASKKYFLNPSLKHVYLIAVLLGIITLIRPVNGIIIFILPFLSSSLEILKTRTTSLLKEHWIHLFLGVIIALSISSIQMILYKIQSGHFIVYSYGEEGFNFFNPQMINILFSYKKGLFLYTPLTFISLFGGYYLYKKSRFEFFSLFGFLILLTYVLSSWWSWWYGGSFSSRVYVEYLPLFSILLAFILKEIQVKKWKNYFIIFLFLMIIHNQKQTYLYRIGNIHWVDMNKEKYWESLAHPIHWWYYEIRNDITGRDK